MRPGVFLVLLAAAACSSSELRFVPSAVGVSVHAPDGLIAEYRIDGQRGPVLWPLCAVGGEALTRAFPFAEVEGERRDHRHHESCWFAHGAVNGVDFWAGDGSIVAIGKPQIDAAKGEIAQRSEWRDGAGEVICQDRRTWRFHRGEGWRAVDVTVVVTRAAGELKFGDTKEGTMALRLRNEFCLAGPGAAGSITNSEGVTGKSAWGKPARWVAYSAKLASVPHTVAMFDAPGHHGHPTHWHARDYGLFAANPFGLHDFTEAPAGTGDLVVAAGGALRLRYRIWLCTGACDAAAIEAAWQKFRDDTD